MKKEIIIFIVTVSVLLIVAVIFLMKDTNKTNNVDSENRNILSSSNMSQGLHELEEENIDVDELINKLINSEEYSKMSDNEKKEACGSLLERLKEKKAINYYSYSNSNMMYSFEYKDGSLGGIKIKDWDPYLN